ncbi:hypothetical protein Tco_0602628, partial [Tanacetum coccineum]
TTEETYGSLERATTTAGLAAMQDSSNISKTQTKVTLTDWVKVQRVVPSAMLPHWGYLCST